ncbi:glutamate synthase alpha subunit domain protein [Methanococcus vannielii SB]|uniref:Glutamate synthase alpha subunit domain protein n=1 Tax=Methanococcus vannielii (strain ATCC 35089 / DSM 1224 / JCM 13029 / OCM 148 / SB) TaxID=406327 RepID=A6UR61_METVS|nr:tributyrin esterase [Methanococcus vannielii]ABR54983.1 glutamate synthase alpha subunit domain protein [Methanococcus vannielii SB]
MVFGFFKRKTKKTIFEFLKNKNVLEIDLKNSKDCILDFTYNFIWQSNFDVNSKVTLETSFKDIVEHVKNPENVVYIKGNVGHRFCSSMGADLSYFGGNGGKIPTGFVIVDGNIDTRFGISMVSGKVYVKDGFKVKEPIGNIIEVQSDIEGYKKYMSITEILEQKPLEKVLSPNLKNKNSLTLNDKLLRDTIGARLEKNAEITVNGNVELSTGILMKNGTIIVNGNAGKNTGSVLKGGTVIINGDTADFTASDMVFGNIIINGNAGKFLGAKKKGGKIYAKTGSSIPPTKKYDLNQEDKDFLAKYGFNTDFINFINFIKFE